MNFQEFLTIISKIKSLPLGGLKDQFKLAPSIRLGYDAEKIKALEPRKAAVLILFYPNHKNDASFLLTKRASYSGTHSAQISFPGGKFEISDESLHNTALRESYEEVGVPSKKVNIFKEITDVYIPPSNFLVTPFMGYSLQKPSFKINNEVDQIIEVSVTDLLNDKNIGSIEIETSYMKKTSVPCFQLNNFTVWGATAMMLSEIKESIIKSQL